MFQYFPTNYVWNLSINLALQMGAEIGEIDDMCRPLLAVAAQGNDTGTRQFLESFQAMGDKLCGLAEEDEAKGRKLSAGQKYYRAAVYFCTAERMQAHDQPGRAALYRKVLDTFERSLGLRRANGRRVSIPYEGTEIAGYWVEAEGIDGPAPVVVHINGLDSTKEMLFGVGLPERLARRGVSSLVIDQPGTGEALRLHNLPAVYNSEIWASRVVDWLETRADVDPKRIALHGVSLGGYYCPRAVAFEPRFAAGSVLGANHNWGEVQHGRLRREGENPVPHYWGHVMWVFGAPDMETFMPIADKLNLDGVLDRIRVPFLVTHGENDRQINIKYAHQTFDQLVNSPRRELKIFTPREGGVEHAAVDNSSNAGDYIVDWLAEVLGGITE